LTASAAIDKHLVFMRVRLANHSNQSYQVDPDSFTATDANQVSIPLLSPKEVMRFLHGDASMSLIKPPPTQGGAGSAALSSATVREISTRTRKEGPISAEDAEYRRLNAAYLNQESLWRAAVEPGKVADGLIYFKEPAQLPFTLHATLNGVPVTATFAPPAATSVMMSSDDLIRFFESQKKGTPIRLTLRNAKVFAGRFSSYDPDNETVWFDTPVGGLLNSASFALKAIRFAQPIEQPSDSKTLPADTTH
jgi:hypothetical protein